MATDGVWDNLFNEDIQFCVNSQVDRNGDIKNLQSASDCISTLAESKSYDLKYKSPFYVESLAHKTKEDHLGGKEDDITVIVSQINVS